MSKGSNLERLCRASDSYVSQAEAETLIEGLRVVALELDCLITSAHAYVVAVGQDASATRKLMAIDAQSLLSALQVFGLIKQVETS